MSGAADDSDIAATVAAMSRVGERFELLGVDGWLQGRTMYGGASSYLAYAAVRAALPDLPPLRGAQVGFVAPVGPDLAITVSVLREGRSVSQIQTDLTSDGALAHRGLWLFGSARPSNGEVAPQVLDNLVPYADARPAASRPGLHFIRKFDIRHAEREGAQAGVIRRWVRLKARGGLVPVGELVLIGDALPPGSLREMEREGPISSINWSFTLLGDNPTTHDGWWLLETASNHMADGFSSETLRMWNSDGVEVMRGLQSVAIFG
ncbi:acyl-CoA thioesterase [Novosphingobium hassiacum]|uniref:Acyl-CoA thioesterase n=1 Tax=Novosphingobium hassiacum TaxID=173676 RepID=A0A7W6EUI8_9SPHN|nr:thioesterase family protein [Novosphingobium hassiacum]MBB3859232.1 acyl-CoA thioesterase [Novosphingobium hassiacum]